MLPVLLCLVAVPALAGGGAVSGEVLSGAEFEALSAGQTLHFSHLGQDFGSEQYLGGRRTIWRFADGSCQTGDWWDERGLICFRYEGGPAQCWRFTRQPGGLAAELVEGADPGFVLEMAGSDRVPLDCPGPDTGV